MVCSLSAPSPDGVAHMGRDPISLLEGNVILCPANRKKEQLHHISDAVSMARAWAPLVAVCSLALRTAELIAVEVGWLHKRSVACCCCCRVCLPCCLQMELAPRHRLLMSMAQLRVASMMCVERSAGVVW